MVANLGDCGVDSQTFSASGNYLLTDRITD